LADKPTHNFGQGADDFGMRMWGGGVGDREAACGKVNHSRWPDGFVVVVIALQMIALPVTGICSD
jgi:hypothetical protein